MNPKVSHLDTHNQRYLKVRSEARKKDQVRQSFDQLTFSRFKDMRSKMKPTKMTLVNQKPLEDETVEDQQQNRLDRLQEAERIQYFRNQRKIKDLLFK